MGAGAKEAENDAQEQTFGDLPLLEIEEWS
jgi:hypothetical protein